MAGHLADSCRGSESSSQGRWRPRTRGASRLVWAGFQVLEDLENKRCMEASTRVASGTRDSMDYVGASLLAGRAAAGKEEFEVLGRPLVDSQALVLARLWMYQGVSLQDRLETKVSTTVQTTTTTSLPTTRVARTSSSTRRLLQDHTAPERRKPTSRAE